MEKERIAEHTKNDLVSSVAHDLRTGMPGDLVAGANIAGFLKVADAMLWQGISY